MDSSLESKVEALCALIQRADNEEWDTKNKAVLQLTELFLEYEHASPSTLAEVFTPTLFRALKEPVKALVCDLRSQQVRDTCAMLTILSQVAGDKMKLFLRDSFSSILEGIKVPNKVMSGYVDECIFQMIKFTCFKSALPLVAQEVRENKSKVVREKCLDYLNEMLISWELTDKEVDPICETVRLALFDASVKAREVARIAYGNIFLLFPHRTEKIRGQLPKPLQMKLLAVEQELAAQDPNGMVAGKGLSMESIVEEDGESVAPDAQENSPTAESLRSDSGSGKLPAKVGTAKSVKQQQISTTNKRGEEDAPLRVDDLETSAESSSTRSGGATRSVKSHSASTAAGAEAKRKLTREKDNKLMSPVKPSKQILGSSSGSVSATVTNNTTSATASSGYATRATRKTPAATSSSTTSTKTNSKYRTAADDDRSVNSTEDYAHSGLGPEQTVAHSLSRTGSSHSLSQSDQEQHQLQQQHFLMDGPFSGLPHHSQREMNTSLQRAGASSRRRSIVRNPFADLSDSFAGFGLPAPPPAHHGTQRSSPSHSVTSHNRFSPMSSPGTANGHMSPQSVSRDMHATSGTSSQRHSPSKDIVQHSHPFTVSSSFSSKSSPSKVTANYLPETLAAMSQREREREETRQRLRQQHQQQQQQQQLIPSVTPAENTTSSAEPEDLSKLTIGTTVSVCWGKDPTYEEIGTIRFVGTTLFAAGDWIGVELHVPKGKNNGSVQGQVYFSCPLNYGLFVRPDHVTLLPDHLKSASQPQNGLNSTASSETTNTTTSTHHSTIDEPLATAHGDSSHALTSLMANATLPGPTGARKKASVLKIKLSQMMNLLNQQLEMVEELERAERQVNESSTHEQERVFDHIEDLKEEINMITSQEIDVIEGFRRRWAELA